MIVTDANRHLLSSADLEEWQAAVERGEELHGPIEDPVDEGAGGKADRKLGG